MLEKIDDLGNESQFELLQDIFFDLVDNFHDIDQNQDALIADSFLDQLLVLHLFRQQFNDDVHASRGEKKGYPFLVLFHQLINNVQVVLKGLVCLIFEHLVPLLLGQIGTVLDSFDELLVDR